MMNAVDAGAVAGLLLPLHATAMYNTPALQAMDASDAAAGTGKSTLHEPAALNTLTKDSAAAARGGCDCPETM
jgi:hypothetical protein